MKNIGEFFSEHKKLGYFIIFLIVFYYLIAVPMENIIDHIHDIEKKEKRFENIILKKKITEKNIDKLKIRKAEEEKEYKEALEKEKFFSSAGEFQNYLYNFFIKYNIEIREIGRAVEEDNKYIVPYIVSGKEEDIWGFILEGEQDKSINFMNGTIEIEKSENSRDTLIFSFSSCGNIVRKNKEEKEKKTREEKIFLQEDNSPELTKYIMTGDKSGIFYFKFLEKTERYYFVDNEIIIVNKKKYKIFLNRERVILADAENSKNRIVFNLEEKDEKKN